MNKVGEGEPVPVGLLADEHVEDGELVDARDDQEEVDERQVHEQLVETAMKEADMEINKPALGVKQMFLHTVLGSIH